MKRHAVVWRRRGLWRKNKPTHGHAWALGAQEKTSTCAVSALLRTRNSLGCLMPGFWIPLHEGGLASTEQYKFGSRGSLIGSSKDIAGHEHCRGNEAVADFMFDSTIPRLRFQEAG